MLLSLGRNPYRELEKRLGYKFRKRAFLEMALTHRSYRFEAKDVETDNQRLEFLGDAVLGLVVAARLYQEHHDGDEGRLTDLRSRITSGKALAETARRIGLGDYVRIGKGEEQGGGRDRQSLLADALEAVLGAAYLDSGVRAVEKIAARLFAPAPSAAGVEDWLDNPKGKLQEIAQRLHGRGPIYRCVAEEGPAHQKTFAVEAVVNGVALGRGAGTSRRAAEVEAATEAVRALAGQKAQQNGDGM
jgi:ribonuclease-3